MSTILCPTRGGKASYPNQDKAIALARQRNARLIFLYVYNIQFLHNLTSPFISHVEEEMDEMGEFLLAIAQEKAELAGIKAGAVVRRGIFRHAVKEVIRENQVDTLLIGTATTPQGYIDDNFIQGLVADLQASDSVEVLVARDGEIIAEFPAPSRQNSA